MLRGKIITSKNYFRVYFSRAVHVWYKSGKTRWKNYGELPKSR